MLDTNNGQISFKSSVRTNQIRYLNKRLYAPNTPHEHNYKILVDKNGMFFEGIKYKSTNGIGSFPKRYLRDSFRPEGYLYFSFLNNLQIISQANKLYIAFELEDNSWVLSVPSIQEANIIKNYYNSSSHKEFDTTKFTPNRLDLEHDAKFAGVGRHVINFKKQHNLTPTTSNVCMLDIHVHYLPTFKSDFFESAVHKFKTFFVSIESHGLYIIGLYEQYFQSFFSGKTLYIPNNHIIQVALETKNTNQKKLIIVTKQMILVLKFDEKNFGKYFHFTMSSDAFNQYIRGELDPVFTSPTSSKIFIKKNYQKIAQNYIKENPQATKKLNFKEAIGNDIMIYIFCIPVGYFLLESNAIKSFLNTLHGQLFCLLMIPIIILNITAWTTFIHSQIIKPNLAISISIISVIFIILFIALF